KISELYKKKVSISILRDKEYRLDHLKKTNWKLLKNNVGGTTSAKLRFLILEEEYNYILNIFGENELLSFLKTIVYRLKKMTNINEIDIFSAAKLFDPCTLGNSQKYFAVHLSIKLPDKNITLLFIIRDEMLLFPIGRISTDPLLKLKEYLYKKAFIELDKHIIWYGMQNWGKELQKKMYPFIKEYPVYKYRLYPSNDVFAYKLLLQYLYLLKLLDREKLLNS
ncbi:MAG: hypothetical protein KAT05_15000, partial [Spirochaetes bacterium]|nr:hypothetical protein [Spirochaetota bacterium]